MQFELHIPRCNRNWTRSPAIAGMVDTLSQINHLRDQGQGHDDDDDNDDARIGQTPLLPLTTVSQVMPI